jgi:hypothetical protein
VASVPNARGNGSSLNARAFAPLLGLVAAIPVIVATVHAIDFGWYPSSDDGMIALRAFDVLSEHPPLVGQYSQSSPLIHEATYSLGPMLYWLLAVPAHLGPKATVLTMGAVNVACVLGVVVLAGRRGGLALAIAAAIAVALMSRSLPVEVPYEVWNCWAGVFPFTLLLFVAWSVACGDYRLLPVLAVVASYVAQVHFTYLIPTVAALGVAVGGLVAWRRLRPAARLRRWAIAAALIGLVCWSAPIFDEIRHDPGNLTLAYRIATDDHPTGGAKAGWKTAARAIGVVPWWVKRSRAQYERVVEPMRVPVATTVSLVLLLAGLLVLLVVALRRRRHELSAGLALATLLILSVALVAGSIPSSTLGFAALTYVLVWTSPAGMWVWLMLAWSAWALRPTFHREIARRTVASGLAGLVAVAAVATLVALGRDYDDPERLPPGLKDYPRVEATSARVAEAVAGSRGVLLDVPIQVRNSLTFQSAVAYALRRKGITIYAPRRLSREMGRQYQPSPGAYDRIVVIRDGDAPILPGSRPVVRIPEVTITIAPAR